MNITKKDIDDLNAVLTVEIVKDDYEGKVEKILKDYRKNANIPGFRKDHVPMGMIKKQHGKAVLIDEVNRLLQDALQQYITDMNVDEVTEVVPFTEQAGIWHPQEGVFNGHFTPTEAEKIQRIGQLRAGVGRVLSNPKYCPDPSRGYKVADMITGFGVAQAVKHYYAIYGGEVKGKRAIVQGFGNVGSSAAYFLSQMDVKIVGIIDRDGGVINQEGFTFEEIKAFYLNKDGNLLVADNMIPYDEINQKIWELDAEIFAPCAGSRLVTKEQVEKMIHTGMEVISCGANVPFADKEIFFGSIMEYTDKHLSLIPDFISNCGMARVFAYLMEQKVTLSDEAIFEDASDTIAKSIQAVYKTNPTKTNISKTAFEIALAQLL